MSWLFMNFGGDSIKVLRHTGRQVSLAKKIPEQPVLKTYEPAAIFCQIFMAFKTF
jgi:hypothetical protein